MKTRAFSLLVVDEARTSVSVQIIAELENSTAVRPELADREEAQNQFENRRADVVFIIPAGIDIESLQNGEAQVELLQQPNNLNATVAERAVLTAIRRVSSSVSAAQNAVKQREAKQPFRIRGREDRRIFESSLETAQSIQKEAPERVTVVEALTEDRGGLRSACEFIRRTADHMGVYSAVWDFGIVCLRAPAGNAARLLTTPSSKATFLLGTISGQVVMALVQMLLLVGFGILVMKLNWGREPLALFVILLTSALAAAALGTTMGTFIKTEGAGKRT